MGTISLEGWVLDIQTDKINYRVDLGNIIELAIIFGVFALAYNAGQHDALAYQTYWYWYTHSYCFCPDAYDNAMRELIPRYVYTQRVMGLPNPLEDLNVEGNVIIDGNS